MASELGTVFESGIAAGFESGIGTGAAGGPTLRIDIFGYCEGQLRMLPDLHFVRSRVVDWSPITGTQGRLRLVHSSCIFWSSAPMITPSRTPALASAATQLCAIVATEPVEKVTSKSEPRGSREISGGSATLTRCPLHLPMSQYWLISSSRRLREHCARSFSPCACISRSKDASVVTSAADARGLGPQ